MFPGDVTVKKLPLKDGGIRKRKRKEEAGWMETTDEGPVDVVEAAHPVWCTEDVLLPLFTDESQQAAMHSQPPRGPPAALPELRLVLLGRKGAGKSAAGNTILGGGFVSGRTTEECVWKRADVAGRKVTVVDTPGWEWYYPLNRTPSWVKREISQSVSLCPPGPHALLLVVRSCASVTEASIAEMEEHLEPLGRGVWDHTMLLFTRGDELGLGSMDQKIQTSGAALQRLLHMCGGRYHVVNNLSRGDGEQVTQLIRKLEAMAAGKEEEEEEGSRYLQMDNTVLLGVDADGTRRARERWKKQRQMEAQIQRRTIQTALSDGPQASESDAHHSSSRTPRRLHELRLVLLGERETGKSSAGNAILGGRRCFQAGQVTEECVCQQAEVATRQVTVVDTPGWEAGDTPERVKREIVSSVALCPPGPHAVLVTLRVDTLVRAGHVREHLELLGEGVWRHTMLLFTRGDQLREGVDMERHIQGGGRDMQWLVERCRGRYHVISSADGGGGGGSTELLEKVEKMAATNRCEAFSDLVVEVRNLSRQRNESFNQRMKEVSDKMLRQEAELKNMRQREMKSIWSLFDRRRKVKPAGKADVQKEEEDDEDRTTGGRKNICELEERMSWLTEDKEKEIQDLSVENERIRVALSQRTREQDQTTLSLERQETEIQELRGELDEQQMKLLDLQHASVEEERERKQREDVRRREVELLEEDLEMFRTENEEWRQRVESLEAEAEETKRHFQNILEKKAEERTREMVEMKEELKREMEVKLLEKDDRMKTEKQQHEEEMERKLREKESELQDQMDKKLREVGELMEARRVQHQQEVDEVRRQHAGEMKNTQRDQLREITELRGRLEEDSDRTTEMEELEQKHFEQMEETTREHEKETETIRARHRRDLQEKEKEVEALKLQRREEARETEKLTEARRVEHLQELERRGREHQERVRERCDEEIRVIERERRREREELEEKYAAQEEEKRMKNERWKETMNQNHLKEMRRRDGLMEALKSQRALDIEERRRERDKEKQRMEEKEKEVEEVKLNIQQVKEKLREMEERETSRSNDTNDIQERLGEKEREVEELKEEEGERLFYRKQMEEKLEEKERVIEKFKQRLKDIEEREEEMIVNQKKEAEQQLQDGEREMERKLEKDEQRKTDEGEMDRLVQEMDEVKKTCANHLRELDQLRGRNRQHTEEKDMMERLQEKEEELSRLQQRDREHEREVVQLRLKIEQTRSELKELTGRMEREMTSMIQGYEKEMESVAREKDEGQQRVLDVTQRYEESLKRVEELLEQNEKMREETEDLRRKWEELKSQHVINLRGHEEKVESIQRARDLEVGALKEEHDKLKGDIKRMKESEGEAERKFRTQLSEFRVKDEEKLLRREQEVNRNREETSRRGHELDAKEEELVEKEGKLESRERELRESEASLEVKQEEAQKTEEELQSLLRALEGKQRELTFHGEDLQKKVKGLKEQGRELRERQNNCRDEEQELLTWRSELQVQDEQVSSAAQQLDDMRRDVERLKDELHGKEKKLKSSLRKLRTWQEDLEEREAELRRREGDDVTDSVPQSSGQMYREVSVEGERERKDTGRESERMEEEQRGATATSADGDNNCHLGTLKEGEEKGGMTERGVEVRNTNGVKVTRGLQVSSSRQRSFTTLRVAVLGESWSSHAPAGVTLLGGQAPKPTGSGFRSWTGQIAGRQLAVVEPLGLRWRDGPDPTDPEQRQNILDSISCCRQATQVVLLLVPAFMTCTRNYRRAAEEHLSLLGDEIWRRTLVIFTWGETLGESAEQHILRNSELTTLVGRCGGRYHVLTSRNRSSLIGGLFEKMEDLVDSRGTF